MKTNTKKIMNEVNEAVEELNKQLKGDSYTKISKARAFAQESINELNKEHAKEVFDEILSVGNENAVKKALEVGFADFYALTTKKEKSGEVAKLDTRERVIDLVALDKHCEKGSIFNNGQWLNWIEYLRNNFAKKAALDIAEKEESDRVKKLINEHISDATKACGGKTAKDPTSINSLTTCLQQVVDAIIFNDNGKGENVYKVTSKDVKYILYTAFRDGKERFTVTVPNKATMVAKVTEVCAKLVCGGEYKIDYQARKKTTKTTKTTATKTTAAAKGDKTTATKTTKTTATKTTAAAKGDKTTAAKGGEKVA